MLHDWSQFPAGLMTRFEQYIDEVGHYQVTPHIRSFYLRELEKFRKVMVGQHLANKEEE